jgi:hypothetical protein
MAMADDERMRHRSALVLVGFSFVGSLSAQAQAPRPAAESARQWRPEEAQAMAFATRLANAITTGAGGKQMGEQRRLPGYAQRLASRDREGQWRLDGADGVAAGGGGGPGDALFYLVPDGSVEGARRIVCIRGDGAIAFTDNIEGTATRDGRELAADDVLAGGSKGTLRDFPRTPTIGGDKNLWLPADQAPRASLRVLALGDDGKEFAGLGVATVVAEPEHAIDALLPAAFARTLLEGDAMLHGVPARGLGFCITVDFTTMMLPKAAVRLDGATARLTVPTDLLARARRNANESAAIATLKNISSAQAQCQASGAIDANQNGAGEYGTFAELAGKVAKRGALIVPPVLSTAFARVENGVTTRSGYHFRIWLPGKDAAALAEMATGGPDAAIDAAQAETLWCCYAWPVEPGKSGQRAFFVDQHGDVLACDNADSRYAGIAKMPAAPAARAAGSAGAMSAPVAANAAGHDGQTWRVVP